MDLLDNKNYSTNFFNIPTKENMMSSLDQLPTNSENNGSLTEKDTDIFKFYMEHTIKRVSNKSPLKFAKKPLVRLLNDDQGTYFIQNEEKIYKPNDNQKIIPEILRNDKNVGLNYIERNKLEIKHNKSQQELEKNATNEKLPTLSLSKIPLQNIQNGLRKSSSNFSNRFSSKNTDSRLVTDEGRYNMISEDRSQSRYKRSDKGLMSLRDLNDNMMEKISFKKIVQQHTDLVNSKNKLKYANNEQLLDFVSQRNNINLKKRLKMIKNDTLSTQETMILKKLKEKSKYMDIYYLQNEIDDGRGLAVLEGKQQVEECKTESPHKKVGIAKTFTLNIDTNRSISSDSKKKLVTFVDSNKIGNTNKIIKSPEIKGSKNNIMGKRSPDIDFKGLNKRLEFKNLKQSNPFKNKATPK